MIGEVEKDRKNREIMNYILSHANAKVAEIAGAVGLKRPATQKRINKLLAERKIERKMVVNPDALGYVNHFRINVRTNPSTLDKSPDINDLRIKSGIENHQILLALLIMAKSGCKNVLVEDVCVLLGDPADLSVTVRAENMNQIFEFITTELRTIDGITETTTCVESWSIFRDQQTVSYMDSLRRTNKMSRIAEA